MSKQQLQTEIKYHQDIISTLENEIEKFDSLLENNQFDEHKMAEYAIRKRFSAIANEECEGAYNLGDDEYSQQYQIRGNEQVFTATVTFEYGRHDKTYYYIDGTTYSFA